MIKMSEAKLTIKIENKRPIEITDFTDSFNSLANQYYKYLSENESFKLNQDTKLYIKEIRSGSIITELSDLVPLVLPFVENSNSVIEFTGFLKKGFDYFLGKTEEKPKEFDLKDCNNFNNIIKPIAKDNGSNVLFNGDWNFENITVNFNFNSVEANAIQNGIQREKENLKEPTKNIQHKVLFYWDSAKYDEKSKSVDKGYIDSVSFKSLRVSFDDDYTKRLMLDIEENPFHLAYIVDVEIMDIQNVPTVYKILKMHEFFQK